MLALLISERGHDLLRAAPLTAEAARPQRVPPELHVPGEGEQKLQGEGGEELQGAGPDQEGPQGA